jgi:dTDP-4-amino-4,6-dideoxygalactose transaminase
MWTFSIRVNPKFSNFNRDEIIEKLKVAGVETRPGFYTFNQMKMYDAPLLEVSDKLASQIICLPFYLDLKDEEIDHIYQELLKLKR